MLRHGARFVAFGVLVGGCASSQPVNPPTAHLTGDATVHCLLPPRVQQLGSLTYAARRELVFETSSRCTLRGGEYTVYDRSTPESSAAFYLEPAQAGDPEAQYSLGLVYEALYNPPRYADAAAWYQKAAAQDHVDAKKNLAFLYEKGLGVPMDSLAAVNLLRDAGGITDDLVLRSELEAATSAAQAEIRELTAVLEAQNSETLALQSALAELNHQLEVRHSELLHGRQQLAELSSELEAARSAGGPASSAELDALQSELAESQRLIASKEVSIATLEADLTAYQAQVVASEKKAALKEEQLLSRLAEAEGELAAAKELVAMNDQEKDARIRELDDQLAGVMDSLRSQKAENEALLAELESGRVQLQGNDDATKEVNRLLAEVAARDATIATQMERIGTLERDRSGAVAQVEEMNDQVDSVNVELATLREQLAAQEGAFAELQARLVESRSQLSQSEVDSGRIDRLMTELERRSALITTQTQQIKNLEAEVATARDSIEELETASARQASERDVLEAQLVATEAELVRTRSNLATLQTSLVAEQAARSEINADLLEAQRQLDASRQSGQGEVDALRRVLAEREAALSERDARIAKLNDEISRKEEMLVAFTESRAQQLAMRSLTPKVVYPRAPGFELPPGKKYALVIGNDRYDHLRPLSTAVNGAKAVDRILRDKYGFDSSLLVNARRQDILDALQTMQRQVGPEDYVLIYFAGHGDRDQRDQEVTYWLGVDARADEMTLSTDGINSINISMNVRAMPAKHVMIIADSCYSGAMIRPPRVSSARAEIDRRQLDWYVRKRSRTVLTSGGNSPVLDESVDGEHSVFTKALVKVLEENPDIIYGEALHAALVNLVRYNAEQLDFTQEPQYSEIADADHRNGQFVFKSVRS